MSRMYNLVKKIKTYTNIKTKYYKFKKLLKLFRVYIEKSMSY